MKIQSYQILEHNMDSACYTSYARDTGCNFIVRIVIIVSFIEISALLNCYFTEPHTGEKCTFLQEKRLGHGQVGID